MAMTEDQRADLEFRAGNVREAIRVARELGDVQGVRDLNRTLSSVCGEAERAAGKDER